MLKDILWAVQNSFSIPRSANVSQRWILPNLRLCLLPQECKPERSRSAQKQERDCWLYEKYLEGMPLKEIHAELRRRCRTDRPDWLYLKNYRGLSVILKRHAEKEGLSYPLRYGRDDETE